MRITRAQTRIWEIVEVAKPGDTFSKIFDVFILLLILLNALAVIFGTVDSFVANYGKFLDEFEVFSVTVFSVEYALHVWSCITDPRYKGSIIGRIRYIKTPLAIIDLLAIAPFFISVIGIDLRFVRIIRLTRILRVAKLGRYVAALGLLIRVLKAKREELIVTTVMMLLLLVFASSLMYYAENAVQPDEFPNIPATMWWAIATLTTVGYGDVYPITAVGRLLASFVAILGIGLFALPTGILGSGFVEELQHNEGRRRNCPHCGKEID